ncbi:hypothetical protein DPEC_G00243240 [Dallia pectoralis]|uniref:Uncharacterized protein n=1 Tax=Dallia pectoralis TaxID=75939 RepID=A0ACC2FVH8_DALPE|nr:hypothetical protein DPEC_G00243240 [Dallia pectoralis]
MMMSPGICATTRRSLDWASPTVPRHAHKDSTRMIQIILLVSLFAKKNVSTISLIVQFGQGLLHFMRVKFLSIVESGDEAKDTKEELRPSYTPSAAEFNGKVICHVYSRRRSGE